MRKKEAKSGNTIIDTSARTDVSTEDPEEAIAEEFSRLLEVYGSEALECFDHLSILLKDRVEHPPPADQSRPLPIPLGNVEHIVLQTLQMEKVDTLDVKKERLVEAGLNVIRYWAILQESNDDQESVDQVCVFMTHYPQNELIQEAACVRLSKETSLLMTTSTENQVQRTLFPVLQAMNWHRNNLQLWNGGMVVIQRLLIKSGKLHERRELTDTIDLTERQTKAMGLIDLTGGLNIFFDALQKKFPAEDKNRKTATTDLKVNVCNALAALALNHPPNQALIAQHPEISSILDIMKLMGFFVPIQHSILQLLASLAYGNESKAAILAKGGLDCILTSMKDHQMDSDVQATGCRAIANLFAGMSADLKAKGALCIKPTLRAMRMHPPLIDTLENSTCEDEDKDRETSENGNNARDQELGLAAVQIHFYGCAALGNLSKVHARAVIEAGGIATLLITLSEYINRPSIQEQAWGAMFFLLMAGTKEDCMSVVVEGGLTALLNALRYYSQHPRIQVAGLGCLHHLSDPSHGRSVQEAIVGAKAVDVVLASLHRHHTQGPAELLVHGCCLLTNLVKDSPDHQLLVIVKNGVNVLVMVLQHAKSDLRVQLAACMTLRQLCRNPSNLQQIIQVTSKGALLPTLTNLLKSKAENAMNTELMECSLDCLSRLVTLPTVQKDLVSHGGLSIVVEAIRDHDGPDYHTSVVPVGMLFLQHISADPDATLWMKRNDLMTWLQSLQSQLPRWSPARGTVKEIVQHLQTSRAYLSKFQYLRRRSPQESSNES